MTPRILAAASALLMLGACTPGEGVSPAAVSSPTSSVADVVVTPSVTPSATPPAKSPVGRSGLRKLIRRGTRFKLQQAFSGGDCSGVCDGTLYSEGVRFLLTLRDPTTGQVVRRNWGKLTFKGLVSFAAMVTGWAKSGESGSYPGPSGGMEVYLSARVPYGTTARASYVEGASLPDHLRVLDEWLLSIRNHLVQCTANATIQPDEGCRPFA